MSIHELKYASRHSWRIPQWLKHIGQQLPQRPWSDMLALTFETAHRAHVFPADLSFLHDKTVCICIEDLGVRAVVRYCHGHFRAAPSDAATDISLRATAFDYLRLLRGEEDPDTLFFQRRLRLEGDTELGLTLKNLLDGIEPPGWLIKLIGAY